MDAMEKVAIDQAEIISRLVCLVKDLINELSQYRIMDAEEKLLEELIKKTGGA